MNRPETSAHPAPSPTLRHLAKRPAAAIVVCAALFAPAAVADVLEVGACPGGFADLQSAVDAAEDGDEIRLTAAVTPPATVVVETSLTISGGWTCGGDTPQGRTRINGSGAARTILVRRLGPQILGVRFERIELDALEPWRWPDGPLPTANAGGIRIRGNVYASFVDVALRGSFQRTTGGGALAIDRGGAVDPDPPSSLRLPFVQIADSEILRNATALPGHPGGAVHCATGTLVVMRSDVRENFAESDGGGIALGGSDPTTGEGLACDLIANDSTIAGNRSLGDGGGIVSRNGSEIQGTGLHIVANVATHGGGLYGVGTPGDGTFALTFMNTRFLGNGAEVGAGAALRDVPFSMQGRACRADSLLVTEERCAAFLGNLVTDDTGGNGAAVDLRSSEPGAAFLYLAGTFFAGNETASGALVHAVGSRVWVVDSVLVDNAAPYLFMAEACDEAPAHPFVEVLQTTIHDNAVQDAIVHAAPGGTCPTLPVRFRNSLIFASGNALDAGTTAARVCVGSDLPEIAGSPESWLATATQVFTADRVHLRDRSPAIDACTSRYSGADFEGDPRPEDGRYDAGADEHTPRPANLFTDGFESGDLAAWSAAVP